ncbi:MULTISPECIES: hypothetical protein [Bacillus]|uniref:hypothetical protein n=1 Tax=Bacillus TaxID=1386 RepID=UPI0003605D8A|nr:MULTISPECIES: hypothetical protein [Bacillus]
MNVILSPSVDLIVVGLMSVIFLLALIKDQRILSIIISRLFLVVGCVIFVEYFFVGSWSNINVLESGSLFFECGLLSFIISSFVIYKRQARHLFHSENH